MTDWRTMAAPTGGAGSLDLSVATVANTLRVWTAGGRCTEQQADAVWGAMPDSDAMLAAGTHTGMDPDDVAKLAAIVRHGADSDEAATQRWFDNIAQTADGLKQDTGNTGRTIGAIVVLLVALKILGML